MPRISKFVILATLMALAFLVTSPSIRASGDETLHYELKFEAPNTHLMDITIRASGLDGNSAEFAIPAWAPGSYQIENYWILVQGFRAVGPDGKRQHTVAEIAALIWEACDKDPADFELEHLPSFEVDVQRRWPSVEKAKRVLGWESKIDLRDGLRQTANWLREVSP